MVVIQQAAQSAAAINDSLETSPRHSFLSAWSRLDSDLLHHTRDCRPRYIVSLVQ
jgi:hypothetical protein